MGVIAHNRNIFPHIVVVPEAWEFSSLWVSPKNVGGFLGLEVKEPLFQPSKRALKRIFDVCLTILLLITAAPVFLIIAALIKIDSRGSIFYVHKRIGRGGVEFNAWKFRSMRPDAESLLNLYLAENPEMAFEWERNHKLRCDPRTTRVGRLLRRTSLDELPQLWNVLRGEMSLVGPRPIVKEEIHRYGRHFSLYTGVQGGLTGLWQVSGRSSTSYDERVAFDTFYARNWSIWLDLYILFRTIGVLFFHAGAY
jgi:Undecaprenyl-phosphate galactose phosphotransferase WbaP